MYLKNSADVKFGNRMTVCAVGALILLPNVTYAIGYRGIALIHSSNNYISMASEAHSLTHMLGLTGAPTDPVVSRYKIHDGVDWGSH
jgi:hypothetical protein